MRQLLTVDESRILQSDDNLGWVVGDNPVIFGEPFADISYTFQPTIEDSAATIVEKVGTRTPAGLTITVAGSPTSKGNYIAVGPSNEFRSAALASLSLGASGLFQRGKQTLQPGANILRLKKAFTSNDWTFTPIGNENVVTFDTNSKTVQTITVYNTTEDPILLEYTAVGT